MFRVLYRNPSSFAVEKRTTIHFNLFGVLQNQNPHLNFISQIHKSRNIPIFAVDYLVNSCGLPPQTALSAAKTIPLFSEEKADSVISLFQSYGLTKTQIANLITQRPKLLLYDPNKNLKPKIEFLCDLSYSGPDLSKIIASDATFFHGSLQNQIIPCFNFLKTYIHTDAEMLMVFRCWPRIFQYNLEKVLIPNISILHDQGVPDCNISKLFITFPRALTHNSKRFKEIVETVQKIGFDPSSLLFLCAVRIMTCLSKSLWEKKLMVFREFGWSDNDILSVFRKQPNCLSISREKTRRALEFFLEKFKWNSFEIALCPGLLLLSLEKRIIPRCAVLEILYSKGIIRKKLNLGTVLKQTERCFLEKFVIEYQETVPEVIKAYKGGVEFAGFGEAVEVKASKPALIMLYPS